MSGLAKNSSRGLSRWVATSNQRSEPAPAQGPVLIPVAIEVWS